MEDRFNDFNNREDEPNEKSNNFSKMSNEDYNKQNSFSQSSSSYSDEKVPSIMGNEDLPNAQGALILGIVSIVLTLCSGLGFLTAIVGLILGINAGKEAKLHPGRYTEASIKNANVGKIMSIVIIGISVFFWVVLIFVAIAGNL